MSIRDIKNIACQSLKMACVSNEVLLCQLIIICYCKLIKIGAMCKMYAELYHDVYRVSGVNQ